MHNDKQTISANEINKYTYCAYQWYYEREYGRKALRAKYVERNRALGLQDTVASHFHKGTRFHSRYALRARIRFWLRLALLLACLCAVAYGFYLLQVKGISL